MNARFRTANGDPIWIKGAALDELQRESGWSNSALKRVRKEAFKGLLHTSQHGPAGFVSKDQLEQVVKLVATDSFNLTKSQLMSEVLVMSFNNHVNKHGPHKEYKAPGATTQYKMLNTMTVVERAGNMCHVEARDLAWKCPYTFITTAANFLAMELMYGAPVFSTAATTSTLTLESINATSNANLAAQPQGEYQRVTRPEHVWYHDESTASTFNVSHKVMKPKGTKHVQGVVGRNGDSAATPVLKTLKQQMNFIWGCNAAGRQLPALIGLRSKKIERGTFQVARLVRHANIAGFATPPMVAIYHPDDKKALVELFGKSILDPCLGEQLHTLMDGEMDLVYQDGGERQHLKPLEKQNKQPREECIVCEPAYVTEQKEKRQVSIKSHVNATGHTSLADMNPLFKLIKQPSHHIKKVSSATFQQYVDLMTADLDEFMTPYFDKAKRKLFIESLAVLFFITLKCLSQEQVTKCALKLGQCPRNPIKTMVCCKTPLPMDLMVHVQDELLHMFAKEMIQTGRLSNATMDQHIRDNEGSIIRLTNGSDDVNLRNDRVVVLAHVETVTRVLAAIQAPLEEKKRKFQERQAAGAAKEAEEKVAYDNVMKLVKNGHTLNKGQTKTVIRHESKTFVPGPDDSLVKCQFCGVWAEVFLLYGERHRLKFLLCDTCDGEYCEYCAKKQVTHGKKCEKRKQG
jgi:hypothetical protein